MPNKIDETGLQVNSLTENINILTQFWLSIYGPNINLDQNSPDAQLLNNIAQMLTDFGELLLNINASFDPDQAVGVVLDQRVKLNGLTRKQGSYTKVYVTVTFDDSTTIKGLDNYLLSECFQVSDNSGNILVCETTTSGVNGEETTVSFRALEYGAVIFNAGSVDTIVTTQLGVASVTNENAQYILGNDEESDSELRIRRTANALKRSSLGEVNNLYAALWNIEGVDYANVLENVGDFPDINGIPGHGIWIIVSQIEDEEVTKNIGTAIYNKRIEGTPMKTELNESSSSSGDLGNQGYYNITRPDGSTFTAYWTKATPQYVDISITAKLLSGGNINATQIEELIRNNLKMQVGEILTTNIIENIILNNIDNIAISDVEITTGGVTVQDYLTPDPDKRFIADNITVIQG